MESPFKNDEKRFLYHPKSSFRSQNIWTLYKRSLIRKARLISKFMTLQPGKLIVQYILSNISRSEGNRTIIFGQLIECNMRNIFLEKSLTKYDAEMKLSCRLFAFTSCFRKQNRFGTSLPVKFLAWFLKKNIFLVIFY